MRIYICLLCSRTAYYQAMIVHIYKVHCNQPAPLQCTCGFVAALANELERHQAKANHSGRMIPQYPVPEHLMYREASQKERRCHKINKEERKRKRASEPLTLDSLDYRDWDVTDTTEDQSWSEVAKKLKTVEDENTNLKKRVEELTRINEVMAADMVEPTIGVPFEAALSGFDATWREESQNDKLAALSRSLFPDPPRKMQSTVVVPKTNSHLSRNERVWKQSSEAAIRKYNNRKR